MLDTRSEAFIHSLHADLIQADLDFRTALGATHDGHDLTLKECDALKDAAREVINATAKLVEVITNLQRFEDNARYLEIESLKAE